jgi:hypothetical protein
MNEDSIFNKDQKKEEERSVVLDFSGSSGKGMIAKEKIETLGNSSGLTPLSFGVKVQNRIMDRENTELKRTETNSDSMSSYGVRTSSLLNSSYQYAQNTEMLGNSPGLTTLHPVDEIHGIKKKSDSLIESLSDNESLETLKNSSGLTPLNYDTEPPMDAVKGRNSPQKTLRTQSLSLTSLANQGE